MKKINLIFCFGIVFILALAFVSANDVCCKRTNSGEICQYVPEEDCNVSGPPTVCEQVASCDEIICINNKGICERTRRFLCEEEGGEVHEEPFQEISECKDACCFWQDQAKLLTARECKQKEHDYGVDANWDETITDETLCSSYSDPGKDGACVYVDKFEITTCRRTKTRDDCDVLGGQFNKGLLCTAPQLETDCVKTINTKCYGHKVYFEDSCHNRANIYDYIKRNDISGYWTRIIKIEDSCGYQIGNNPPPLNPKKCGNCDMIYGTICRSENDPGVTNEADIGDYVCADMGCEYDTDNDGIIEPLEHYEHGESWCAMSPGTYFVNSTQYSNSLDNFHGILINPETGEYTDSDFLKEMIRNPEKYNFPGTEYTRLYCIDGEVKIDPCEPLRKEVCMEYFWGEDNDFRNAKCVQNAYQQCPTYTDFTSCEKTLPQFCKWVEGYRFDGAKTHTNEEVRWALQGSCVPLFAPGFLFWKENTDEETDINGVKACSVAGISEATKYQLSWTHNRDNFADNKPCITSGDNYNTDLVQRCTENCYLIPQYGNENQGNVTNLFEPNNPDNPNILNPTYPRSIYSNIYNSKIFKIHTGGQTPGEKNFEKFCISDMQKYYCDGDLRVTGSKADCAMSAQLPKRKNFPVFFTHDTFLDSIRERARSLGDCGYKSSISHKLDEIEPKLEIINVFFRKLKHNGDPKDEEGVQTIYQGDEYIKWRD